MNRVAILMLTVLAVTACGRRSPYAADLPLPQRPYTPIPTDTSWDGGQQIPSNAKPVTMSIHPATETIRLGTSRQLTVTVQLDNGKALRDFTGVTWSLPGPEYGRITPGGSFTPALEGPVKITATLDNLKAEATLHVLPGTSIWYEVPTPTSNTLRAVKLLSDYEGWAVGDRGTILRLIGGRWMPERSPVTEDLLALDMVDRNYGWAIGNGTLLRYFNGQWQVYPNSVGGGLRSIDLLGYQDGWAVGDNGTVLRYQAGMWNAFGAGINDDLTSVSAVSPNDVWAVGKSKFGRSPAIYHYNGNEWKKVRFGQWPHVKVWTGTYHLKAIKMINGSQGWAVGEYRPLLSSLRGTRGVIFYYDSTQDAWFEGAINVAAHPDADQVPFNNVAMVSGNKGWLVGGTVTPKWETKPGNDVYGNLWTSDGREVAIDPNLQVTRLVPNFWGIDMLFNGNGVVVGDNGAILHHTYDVNRPNRYNNGGDVNSGQNPYGYDPTVNPNDPYYRR